MEPIWIAVTLFVVAAALVAAELVLPGGVLGGAAALAAVAAVVACFFHSQRAGALSLCGLVVLGPVAWWLYVRNIDRIVGARDVVLGPGDPSVGTPVFALRPGQPGVAVSELRPGGVCEFGDQRVPSQSEAGVIRAGTPVRVVAYADGRATVRPA